MDLVLQFLGGHLHNGDAPMREFVDEFRATRAGDLGRFRLRVAPSVEPVRPQFQLLISDPKMLSILERRWTETLACQRVGAALGATVMLGGLLEALFLTKTPLDRRFLRF